jgi:hypothetical protein
METVENGIWPGEKLRRDLEGVAHEALQTAYLHLNLEIAEKKLPPDWPATTPLST